MVVGATVCDLTENLVWFVCGLYAGNLTSSLTGTQNVVRFTMAPFRPVPGSFAKKAY